MPSPAPRRIVYRPDAVRDLEDLIDYIAADRPLAAGRFAAEIRRACEGLAWFPMIGMQLDAGDPRVRVLSIRRRAAVKYLVLDEAVHVLGVSYKGRDLPQFFATRPK